MKLHLIIVALAVTISACRSGSNQPRPVVDYTNETNPWACMIDPDINKRMICMAVTQKNTVFCDSIKDVNQQNFCVAAVQQRSRK